MVYKGENGRFKRKSLPYGVKGFTFLRTRQITKLEKEEGEKMEYNGGKNPKQRKNPKHFLHQNP